MSLTPILTLAAVVGSIFCFVMYFKAKRSGNFVTYPSMTEKDKAYRINIKRRMCSCPDYLHYGSTFPKDSPARLCKHLVQVVYPDHMGDDYTQDEREQLAECKRNKNRGPFQDENTPRISGMKLKGEPKRKSITIKSYTDPTITYEIDPNTWTCTCPDFENRRYRFDRPNPKRLCKHLIQELYPQLIKEIPSESILETIDDRYDNKQGY